MAFFAASCQQEMLDPAAQESTVTYTVELPGLQTKAFMGTVSKVDELIYEVWKTEAADERDLNGTSDNGNAKATLLSEDSAYDKSENSDHSQSCSGSGVHSAFLGSEARHRCL